MLSLPSDAALGDIGELFPDTDSANRDMNSAEIVREVMRRVAAAGWQPQNVDVVVHAERPKLSPCMEAIRERVAQLLGLERSCVNVKAKTGEGIGPIGRGEAISCEAVVLLNLRA